MSLHKEFEQYIQTAKEQGFKKGSRLLELQLMQINLLINAGLLPNLIDYNPIQRQNETFFNEVNLSPTEGRILKLISEGRNSREIAEELGNKVHTVRTHRANILRKLGARSTSHAVAMMMRSQRDQAPS